MLTFVSNCLSILESKKSILLFVMIILWIPIEVQPPSAFRFCRACADACTLPPRHFTLSFLSTCQWFDPVELLCCVCCAVLPANLLFVLSSLLGPNHYPFHCAPLGVTTLPSWRNSHSCDSKTPAWQPSLLSPHWAIPITFPAKWTNLLHLKLSQNQMKVAAMTSNNQSLNSWKIFHKSCPPWAFLDSTKMFTASSDRCIRLSMRIQLNRRLIRC